MKLINLQKGSGTRLMAFFTMVFCLVMNARAQLTFETKEGITIKNGETVTVEGELGPAPICCFLYSGIHVRNNSNSGQVVYVQVRSISGESALCFGGYCSPVLEDSICIHSQMVAANAAVDLEISTIGLISTDSIFTRTVEITAWTGLSPNNRITATVTYTNDPDILNPHSPIEFVDEYVYTGHIPEILYTNNSSKECDVNTTNVVGVDVGTYTTTVTVTYSDGETVDYPYTYTILPAPLTLSVNDAERFYGDTNPEFCYSLTGFVNNENEEVLTAPVVLSTTATKASTVGSYTINVTASAKNYKITVDEGTLTVKKAPLTLTADNARRLYFEENPTFTFHGEGWKNGDTSTCFTVQPTFSCTAKKVSGAGDYEISLSGANAKNYELSYVPGTLTVGKREVTVTVNDAEKTYGEENPEFGYSLSGMVNNESEKVFTSPVVLQCEAEKMSDAGTYEIVASGAEAANYDFVYSAGTLTIGKATQEIIWEQELTDVPVWSQIPLEASATSGLDVRFEIEDNDVISLYEANDRTYIDCLGCGSVVIKAIQEGNHNYYAATRVYKKLTIIDPTGVEVVENEAASVRVTDKHIVVENVREEIRVFDLTGRLMKAIRPTDLRTEIPMESDGLYIVRIGKITKKVAVK